MRRERRRGRDTKDSRSDQTEGSGSGQKKVESTVREIVRLYCAARSREQNVVTDDTYRSRSCFPWLPVR